MTADGRVGHGFRAPLLRSYPVVYNLWTRFSRNHPKIMEVIFPIKDKNLIQWVHSELEVFLRRDAKWALVIICRAGKSTFFWNQTSIRNSESQKTLNKIRLSQSPLNPTKSVSQTVYVFGSGSSEQKAPTHLFFQIRWQRIGFFPSQLASPILVVSEFY